MKKNFVLLFCLILLAAFTSCTTMYEQKGTPLECSFCNEKTLWKIIDGLDQCSVCGNYWKVGGDGPDF